MKEQSFKRVYLLIEKAIGLVAQLVRAPPCHGGGRGFEPHPGRCYHFPDDNLLETAYNYIWGLSSAGRASALQAEGHRFEPCRPHQFCRLGSMAEQLICNQQVVGSTPTVGFRGGLSTDMKMGYCVLIEYGRIPEWPKGTDCKSAGTAFEGSNPSPPTLMYILHLFNIIYIVNAAG